VKAKKSVAVVHLSGVISGGSRGQLNDKALAPVLEKAFSKGKPDAVALVINSPGGSPVQSSLIGARIRRLAAENSLPVFAFVEDIAASGGYWLAVTADEIYVQFWAQSALFRLALERMISCSAMGLNGAFIPQALQNRHWILLSRKNPKMLIG
jgi:hypothetical protein